MTPAKPHDPTPNPAPGTSRQPAQEASIREDSQPGAALAAASPDRQPWGSDAQERGRTRGRMETTAIATLVALGALFLAGLTGYGLAGRGQHPTDTSAEAGFARDMQTHHAQAVQMALIIRDKTTDPVLRTVAYDIATSQQQQAGQMYGWLAVWGLPQTGTEPAMAWMNKPGSGGHDMSTMSGGVTGDTATMPGMATPAQLKNLQQATGVQAERLFLQLMIAHHRGGVQMAQAVLERTTQPEVSTLARSIVTAQQAEIGQMTTLLQERANQ